MGFLGVLDDSLFSSYHQSLWYVFTKKTGEQILSISKGYRTSVMAPILKKLPRGSWFVDDVDGDPCNGLF